MRVSDFYYELPDELIAQRPLPERTGGRLIRLDGDTGAIEHLRFADIPGLLEPHDVLVLNDTRVIAARMFGVEHDGKAADLWIERILDEERVLARLHAPEPVDTGCRIELQGHSGESEIAEVLGCKGEFYELRFPESVNAVLDHCGHLPLPPYIKRPERIDLELDLERYQTVFAAHDGAVAAASGGLGFDESILEAVRERGADVGFCTLHVGAATVEPVCTQTVEEYHPPTEWVEVPDTLVKQIARAWGRDGRVVAVGATTLRALETAALSGSLGSYSGETDLYIRPGFHFRVVDALIANFHQPQSMVLISAAAFAGHDHLMHAYREAIQEQYRFYAYGDAMYMTRSSEAA
jgi:S-adenosylmethionine:tRNA ribosyltransferase-isomerase